jgi:PAS domain S-box-containing protein
MIKKRAQLFINRRGKIVVFAIALLGAFTIWYSVSQTYSRMRSMLLQTAEIVSRSINQDRLKKLRGVESDTASIDYQRIKSQLIAMRLVHKDCRFLYLMRQLPSGEVVFLTDAQLTSSEDYAHPGLIYEEISQDYLNVFKNGKTATVGPVSDRWGTLITSLVPIYNDDTGELLAVLGMDVTVKDWRSQMMKKLFPLILLMLIAAFLVFYIQKLRYLQLELDNQELLKKSQQLYKALFDNAADGIVTGNLKGIITKVNASFINITGYREDELIGMPLGDLFSDAVMNKEPLDYERVLNYETIRKEREFIRKDGNRIVVEMHSKRVDENTLQSFFRDITERIKNEQTIREKNTELQSAEEELRTSNHELRRINEILEKQKQVLANAKVKAEESDKLKSNFLANMSHEIRTPMNAIIGFADLLKDNRLIKGSEIEPYVDTIIQESEHLLQLINDIVDLSKIEADKLSIVKSEVNINKLITDIGARFIMDPRKSVNVELVTIVSLPDAKCSINTDEHRFIQIFNNLISNAIKFTKEGEITFGYTVNTSGQKVFFVEDSGIGIPDDVQQRIFERFYRVHDAHKTNFEGTGLGLSICKSLVDLLGGELNVKSEQGKGSRFEFTIQEN